jgi:hypothetical protein
MKQTATDYLYDQFLKAFIEYVEEKIDGAKFSELMIEARVKSQIMEKEQIIETYNKASAYTWLQIGEQYYNETFNQ